MHARLAFSATSFGRNPGPIGGGCILELPDGRRVERSLDFDHEASTNTAEYLTLLRALEEAASLGCRSLDVVSRSETLVGQLAQGWKVNEPHLERLARRAKELLATFAEATVRHESAYLLGVAVELAKDGAARSSRKALRSFESWKAEMVGVTPTAQRSLADW